MLLHPLLLNMCVFSCSSLALSIFSLSPPLCLGRCLSNVKNDDEWMKSENEDREKEEEEEEKTRVKNKLVVHLPWVLEDVERKEKEKKTLGVTLFGARNANCLFFSYIIIHYLFQSVRHVTVRQPDIFIEPSVLNAYIWLIIY